MLIEGVGISSEKRFVLVQEEDPKKYQKQFGEEIPKGFCAFTNYPARFT